MRRHSVLPRLHLFEFHDQPWYPAVLRSALTEWLRALWEYSQAASVIAPILARVLRQAGSHRMVDLCSGGSGPMIPVQQLLESSGICVPVLATDKYPDQIRMAEVSKKTNGRIIGSLESLDYGRNAGATVELVGKQVRRQQPAWRIAGDVPQQSAER
jgi:hypothetical protein